MSKPRCINVIASVSEAIHRAANGEGWIASELTLLAMTAEFKHAVSLRGAMHPEFAQLVRPLRTEGAGNAGCPMHPQPRVRWG
jgi:hypothetical protein